MNDNQIERLFRTHYSRMYRLALSMLHDEAEAKDAASDIFARLLDGHADLTVAASDDPGRLSAAWLLTSTRNRCLDIINHKGVKERFQRLVTADTQHEPLSTELLEARYERLNHLVDTKLTPQTRHIFLLRTQERLSCRDIASKLHISETAVYKHLTQATAKLKEHFNNDHHGE